MWRTRNKSSFEDKKLIVKVPPHMTEMLPSCNLVIDSINSRFHDSIGHLKRCDTIGVSLSGKNIGRHGHLEWLCLSTSACTYLYDIRKLQQDVFTAGLKTVLENKEIIKVLHDCRMPSDHLFHVYNSELRSVFDTQVGDFIIRVQTEKIENIDNSANTLDYCLQKYLQVPEEYLIKSSDCSFDERPLNDSSRNSLIKDVIYLRSLRKEQDIILHTPFRRCVDVFLNTLILKSDDELKLNPPDKDKIPPELFLENMLVLEINESLKPKTERIVRSDYDEDPYIRYERAILKNRQEMNGVDCANKLNVSNHYGGYSTRRDVVDFLMDKMYAGGYPNRNCFSRASIFGDEEMKYNEDSKIVEQTTSACDNSSIRDVRNISPTLSDVKIPTVNTVSEFVDKEIVNKDQCFESLNHSSDSPGSENKAKCIKLISDGYLSKSEQLLAKIRNGSLSCNVIVEPPKAIETDNKQYLEVCNNTSTSELSSSSVSSKVIDVSPKVIETDSCKRYEQYLEDLKTKDNIASISNPSDSLKENECSVNSELESRTTHAKSDATQTLTSVKKETNLDKDLTKTSSSHQQLSDLPMVLMELNKPPKFELKQNSFVFKWNDWSSDEDDSHSDCKVLETKNTSVKSPVSDNIAVEEEDPWMKLRKAFSELGPPNTNEKIRFIPAGMQY